MSITPQIALINNLTEKLQLQLNNSFERAKEEK